MDYYFGYMDVEEEKQVRLAVCKLRDRAQTWWSQLGRSFGAIDSTTRESVDVNNQQMKNYQNDAFKLVWEAFDEIHLLEIWKLHQASNLLQVV